MPTSKSPSRFIAMVLMVIGFPLGCVPKRIGSISACVPSGLASSSAAWPSAVPMPSAASHTESFVFNFTSGIEAGYAKSNSRNDAVV